MKAAVKPSRGMAVWVTVALTGCGVHVDDWAREFGTAFCKHEQECRRVSTSVDCTRPGYWSPEPKELVALREGLVGYSPADARRCVDLLSKVGCIDDLESRLFHSAECRAAFPGHVSEGEPCLPGAVEVCGLDLRCKKPPQDLCGTCVATARRGEEVLFISGKECSTGLYAVIDGGVPVEQRMGSCQPRHSIGETCGFGKLCLEWLDCSDWRDGGTCVAAPRPDAGAGEDGEACHVRPLVFWTEEWCAWPWTCEASRCVGRTARLGEGCGRDTTCEFGTARCISGSCAMPAREGEACGVCAENLECASGVCQSVFSLYCR